MRVQEISINNEKKFLLINDDNQPIVPVARFLKYLDNTGKAENTLKSYCHHLKLFFEYLNQMKLEYQNVGMNELANFVGWLRNPTQSTKAVQLQQVKAKRSERTVNTIITCVTSFYDYLYKVEDLEKNLSDKTKKQISGRYKTFKPFLHHVTKSMNFDKNILKIKEPKRRIKTLTKDQINTIYKECTNTRDQLLIRVLYEGGLRIGEALSLWIEDFDVSKNSITVRKSKTAEGEGRKVYVSAETMNLFQDYLIDMHDADTSFVFINFHGENKDKKMEDTAVRSLIKRLKEKTKIDFTPHMLRHTYATELYENKVEPSIIQKLLGHAQIQTTLQTYVHPSDETIRKSWEEAKNKKGDIE